MTKFKVKKGDKVKVVTGKSRGKVGEIVKIFPSKNKAIVSGVNLVKKHTKPTQTTEGGVIQKELPIHISNITHLDPKTNESTKIGYKILEDGKKIRFAKKSGEIISTKGK